MKRRGKCKSDKLERHSTNPIRRHRSSASANRLLKCNECTGQDGSQWKMLCAAAAIRKCVTFCSPGSGKYCRGIEDIFEAPLDK
ncbi:hypothetical protein ONS95_002892 [Cadophora gregata]|uniref:uncharacterized protein n=1 Tax=Cadophora gregata TaxID=51156 RepID=UPI0026DBCDFE|nr:uncharacterized protein ONS95_002892 [Cadophora gregata]KAK0108071.1 hypothetical protein ONS95_002892 [Cadophora gregata]